MAKEPNDTLQQDFTQYQLPEPLPGGDLPITPSSNGAVLSSGDFASPNYVPGVSGWKLDAQGNFEAVSGTFSGAFNIPNATSANSFHIDSNGNAWWGSNVATGYTGANAYILNTGAAVFKNIQIGGTTIQYVITNSGIFSYGDGSDADVTISANTTLTRDMYYRNLTVNSGAVVNTGGYRIFCSVSCTLSGSSNIHQTGPAGSNAAGAADGANGTVLAAGYFMVGPAANVSISHTLGGIGGRGGGGGSQLNPSHSGGSSLTVGTVTAALVKLIANWHLATLLDIANGTSGGTGTTFLFRAGTAGTTGGFASNGGFGGGGGGGAAGGIVAIYAKSLTIGAGSSITANGGNGGTGDSSIGGGGGGGGGAGGIVILVYNSLSNSGSVTASAGTGGTGGTQSSGYPGPGTCVGQGSDGDPGSAGVIYQFQLSL